MVPVFIDKGVRMKSFVRSLAVGGWFVMIRFMGRLCGTPLIGATFAHLSLGAAVAPLAGFYGGTVGSLVAGFFTVLIATLIHGSLSLASLALYIPGIIGGLFFANSSQTTPLRVNTSQATSSGFNSSQEIVPQATFLRAKFLQLIQLHMTASHSILSRLIKSLFFIACMVLFWVNPVGQQAFLYPLLWLVPLVLVIINQQSLFARALVSAFAVHAVGACWWLYTMPMNVALWHGMMPLVVVERLVQALCMVGVVNVVAKISGHIKTHHSAVHASIE